MSEVEFVKNLLESQWETSISGRSTDVPEPKFTLEKKERASRLRHQDVGYVTSGADTIEDAKGFGWTHEGTETLVAIEYRAVKRSVDTGYRDPYNRLHGKRTGPNGLGEPDRWDGVIGETKRIVKADRKGRAEWDLIGDELTVVDNAETGGKNYYRADILVPLRIHAKSIDTST